MSKLFAEFDSVYLSVSRVSACDLCWWLECTASAFMFDGIFFARSCVVASLAAFVWVFFSGELMLRALCLLWTRCFHLWLSLVIRSFRWLIRLFGSQILATNSE